MQTDEQIVLSVRSGHISNFAVIVRRYERPLVSFLIRYLGNVEDAEEVAQDAFLSVYRTIGRIDVKRKFASYLFTVAKNGAVSRLRAKKITVPISETDAVEGDMGLYEALADEEEKKRIVAILDSLDRKYSRVLTLYYFDDLSYEEIAHVIRIPLNTVRIRLKRAKEIFGKVYEKTA